jgi:hypothetical protein
MHLLVLLLVIYEILNTQGGRILQLVALSGAGFVRDASRKAPCGVRDTARANAGTTINIKTAAEDGNDTRTFHPTERTSP